MVVVVVMVSSDTTHNHPEGMNDSRDPEEDRQQNVDPELVGATLIE